MSGKDSAVSEVISFILILAVIASVIVVFAAAVLPELEKIEEQEKDSRITESFYSLKTELDKLWILGNPGMQTGHLLPAGSAASVRSGTVSVKSGAEISFDHTDGAASAALLSISCIPHTSKEPLQYEGGAVFRGEKLTLPHTGSVNNTVLLCFSGDEQTLTANSPVAVLYTYQHRETYTNVTNLSLSGTAHPAYWQDRLQDVKTLTLLTYAVSLEAAV